MKKQNNNFKANDIKAKNSMENNSQISEKKSSKKKWIFVIIILFALAFLSFVLATIASVFLGFDGIDSDEVNFKSTLGANVAMIPIKGPIETESSSGFGQPSAIGSDKIVEFIEDANKDKSIKAIILEINSPGGTPVASWEIAQAVKDSDKLTVAWIRDVGASGAYWVASASDIIVANRMSMTGSIGVIGSYLEFSGLMDKYGVGYQRFVSGDYKDFGSPFAEPSDEASAIYQKQIDELHDIFVEAVAKNRNLPKSKVNELATGMVYLGDEAKKLGLIDYIGGEDKAIELIESELNITVEIVEYKSRKTFFDLLSEMTNNNAFHVGEGIGSGMFIAQSQEVNKGYTLMLK